MKMKTVKGSRHPQLDPTAATLINYSATETLLSPPRGQDQGQRVMK